MAEFTLELSAAEAALLDGRVGEKAQAVVNRAKDTLALAGSGLVEKEAAMVAKIVEVAREKGRLTYSRKPIKHCPCCGRSDGYYAHKRTGKYHRKGQPNYSAPKVFMGYGMDEGFITIQYHIGVGYCDTCKPRVDPVLLPMLANIEADYPAYWTEAPHRYRRFENKTCKSCGWEGHEGEMRKARTLMGDGWYPAGCPNCPASNGPLGPWPIERRDGYTIVDTRAAITPTPATDTDGSAAQVSQPIREEQETSSIQSRPFGG